MFLKKKKRIIELIDTICELINYVAENANVEMLNDVTLALESLYSSIENSKSEEDLGTVFEKINSVLSYLNSLDLNEITYEDLEELMGQIKDIEQTFLSSIEIKLNIAFMPYNVTMWDSLESIYLACREDEDCVAKLVPIPYYDISQEEPVFKYDLDKYDKDLEPIDFREFSLELEEPDVIYVHNIYDDGNILTTVQPDYYTSNLKQYTDMLVYSPYCIPNFLKRNCKSKHSYTFGALGAKNIDRFVSAGDFVKEEGLQGGVPKEKILNLGTPKFDSLIKNINQDFEYPKEWIEKSAGKRVVLYSTSINFFVAQMNNKVNPITNFCDVIFKFSETLQQFTDNDIFVIWRPHPLTRNYIAKIHPHFAEWYDHLCDKINGINRAYSEKNKFENVVLDVNTSYLPAFKISDAFVTDYTSIMFAYMLLNKKLIFSYVSPYYEQEIDINKYEDKIGFGQLIGIDRPKEFINFKKSSELEIDDSLLSKFYKNLDGTAGEKIHRAIKNDVLNGK